MTNTTVLTATMAATLLVASAAGATGVTRAWVSGHGTDAAACGAPTSPCRSLQYVHDHIIAAGGEIDVLDPAGYGAISITKAISIVNDGVGTAGVQASSGNAINIIAGIGDSVTLRGLNIDGLGSAHDGIGLAQAGKLTVANCVIRHFAHDGIDLQPTSQMTLAVIGVTAADNANNGIELAPNGGGGMDAVVDHSYAISNGANGVTVSGVAAGGELDVTVVNDDLSSNGAVGVLTHGISNTRVVAKANVVEYNNRGYYAQIGSIMIISQSLVYHSVDVDLLIDNGGQIFTYGDNQINSTRPGTGTLTAISSF